MRATILPWAVILTKARRATVSMMAKGVLWPLIFTTQLYLCLDLHYNIQYFLCLEKWEILQQEYSQIPEVASSHF